MSTLKNQIAVTANRLSDGEVVWLGTNGRWVETVDSALVLSTEEERAAALAQAHQADADNIVLEPYEIDVQAEQGAVIPVRLREQIRAAGPTMRLDLGKQAEQQARAA